MPRTLSHFCLSGEFDPDLITQQLGIQPSWVLRIGDPGPPGARGTRKGAEWCLAADEEWVANGDVSDQIISLVTRLKRKSDTVTELCMKFDGTIKLVAHLNGNYPGFFLMASVIRDLANLNVDVDCNYVYASDEPMRERNDVN